jgi:hypothetical protein
VSAAAPVRLTRASVLRLVDEAVEAGRLTREEAADVLAAYDAGELTEGDLERIERERADPAALALVLVALAAVAVARRRGPAVRWRFDARRVRYVDGRGRDLHPAALRRALDTTLERAAAPVRETAERVASGALPLASWRVRMEEWLAERHIATAAMAVGGVDNLTEADRLWLRERILAEYDYLDGFEAAIRAGRLSGEPLSDAAIRARIDLYNQAARATFEAVNRRAHERAGFTEERRRLGAVERHCDVCPREARRGWQPVGTLLPIGATPCIVRCKCRFEYRRPS